MINFVAEMYKYLLRSLPEDFIKGKKKKRWEDKEYILHMGHGHLLRIITMTFLISLIFFITGQHYPVTGRTPAGSGFRFPRC